MSLLFVTGSGTGVGKTFVARILVAQLARLGIAVSALKPVVTGFDPDAVATSDTGALMAALGGDADRLRVDQVSPWRYRAALSPDMAASREGRPIPFADLVEFCRRSPQRGMTVIEGVGGVMVPIDGTHTVTDWIAALGCPTVLVTGSYLGTISHTLTALDVLRSRRIAVAAIVVSESPEQPVPLQETVATIARFTAGVPVVALPRLADSAAAPDLTTALDLAL
jgi:dethiobiotin synthetase